MHNQEIGSKSEYVRNNWVINDDQSIYGRSQDDSG